MEAEGKDSHLHVQLSEVAAVKTLGMIAAYGASIFAGTLAVVAISTPAHDGWQRVSFTVEHKCVPTKFELPI